GLGARRGHAALAPGRPQHAAAGRALDDLIAHARHALRLRRDPRAGAAEAPVRGRAARAADHAVVRVGPGFHPAAGPPRAHHLPPAGARDVDIRLARRVAGADP